MSCSSAIYTADTNVQTLSLTAGQPTAVVNPGGIVRRFGCNLGVSGDAVRLEGRGYYDVDANLTLVPAAAGVVTVSLYQDGVAVPGASQSAVASAAGDAVPVNVSALVRVRCCDPSVLTIVVSTTAALPTTVEVANVGVVAEKI